MAGASRSASIVIAFLMWSKKMKYLDALDEVRRKSFLENIKDCQIILTCTENMEIDNICKKFDENSEEGQKELERRDVKSRRSAFFVLAGAFRNISRECCIIVLRLRLNR